MLFGFARTSQRAAGFIRGRGRAPSYDGWCKRDEAIMGTSIHVELWSEDRQRGEVAAEAVIAEMHRIDRAMSPYRSDSELSLVNREAARRPVHIGDELFDLLAASLRFSQLSDGAFDVTYAAVGRLYDYRAGIRPSDAALAEARAAVGWRHLLLDAQARTVRFGHPGTCIDLGGFAKGHAVDNAARILAAHGVRHAIVSAGGDSRLLGDRCGRPWTIAIRDPRRTGEVVALLPLEETSISTSGDYERYFEVDGVRCHHLLDPRTGRSPDAIRSVTILAADGLTTEALSKTVFVRGLEEGMRLVESLPGVDAVVVDAAGKLHFSSGLLDGVPQTGRVVHQ
jgi:thiamine biosynthesis lipoprotein